MGALQRNNYSWIDVAVVSGGDQWCVKWTNDSGKSRKVSSISATMGTGNGTYRQYDTGASASGTGQNINVRLKAVYGSTTKYSSYTDVDKAVGTSAWAGGVTSTVRADGKVETWTFSDMVVPNGTTVTFYFDSPTPSSGAVLCCNFDNLTDDDIMPPAVDYYITYNANEGSGAPSKQTVTGTSDSRTTTLSSTKPTKSSSTGTVTVTFDANGGSVSPASKDSTWTQKYKFKEWNTKSDGSGTSYSSGGSITITKDTTLYAIYENDGGKTYTSVTLPTPTKSSSTGTGIQFAGWYTAKSGGTKINSPYTPSANITLHAHWQNKVLLKLNGGSALSSTSGWTASGSDYYKWVDAGGSITLPTVTRTSCTFRTWTTAQKSGGTSYSGTVTVPEGGLTLYAHFKVPINLYMNTGVSGVGGDSLVSSASGWTKQTGTNNEIYYTKTFDDYSATGSFPDGVGFADSFNKSLLINESSDATYKYKFHMWTSTRNTSSTQRSSYAKDELSGPANLYALWKYRVIVDTNPDGSLQYIYEGATKKNIAGTVDADKGYRRKYLLWKEHGVGLVLNMKVVGFSGTAKGLSATSGATSATYKIDGTSNYTSNSPTTLYIVWGMKKVSVTFRDGYTKGDDTLKKVELDFGGSVSDSQVPVLGQTYNGRVFEIHGPYGFLGWSGSYKNVTADVDCVAVWEFTPIWIVIEKDGTKVWVPYKPEEG